MSERSSGDRDPDLRQIRAFVLVAEELSFTHAAARVPTSQQALSRQVAALERALGYRLFERDTHRVELTPAGRRVLPVARRMLRLGSTMTAAGALDEQPHDELVVDFSSTSLATGARLSRCLRRRHPTLPVRQVELGVTAGLRALRGGEVDAVLGVLDDAIDGLVVRPFVEERVLVGMREDHALTALDHVPVAALEQHDVLLPASDTAPGWNALLARLAATAGIRTRRYPHTTHGSTAAAAAVRSGECVVPTAAWADPPADLTFLPLTSDAGPVSFGWSVAHRDERSDGLDALIACLERLGGTRTAGDNRGV